MYCALLCLNMLDAGILGAVAAVAIVASPASAEPASYKQSMADGVS
jgi:hypothetical protein